MIDYVIVYAHTEKLEKTHQIVFINKNKPEHLKGMVNLPGGKVERYEGYVAAAVRELHEETGLKPSDKSEVVGRILCNNCEIRVVTVPVTFKDLKPEEEPVFWHLPETDFPNLMPNLRLIIPLIRSGLKNWTLQDMAEWKNVETYEVKMFLPRSVVPLDVKLKGYNESR